MSTPNRMSVVICPKCRDAYLDDGTLNAVGQAFADLHGPNCPREAGLPLEDTGPAIKLLVQSSYGLPH